MLDTWTYRKTERGVQAFKERSSFLTPQLRSLLIMIDGAKSVADLKRFGAALGDIEKSLNMLADEGLIEAPQAQTPTPAATPVGSAPAPAPAPAATAAQAHTSGLSLQGFQRQAVRILLDGIGPMADPICERIERCKSAADAAKAAELGVQLLIDSRRPEAVQKLRALMAQLG